jgi:hypothetical protein
LLLQAGDRLGTTACPSLQDGIKPPGCRAAAQSTKICSSIFLAGQ